MPPTLPPQTKTLRISTQEWVLLEEVTHLTANGNYTYIHLNDGRCYLLSKTMRYFERLLNAPQFFRPDKSCIVNLSFVTAIKHDSIEVTHCHQLPMSRRKRRRMRKLTFLEDGVNECLELSI